MLERLKGREKDWTPEMFVEIFGKTLPRGGGRLFSFLSALFQPKNSIQLVLYAIL